MTSKSAQILQSKYNEKCSQLGDAYRRLQKLQKHITELESELDVLDKVYPIALEVEAKIASKDSEPSDG